MFSKSTLNVVLGVGAAICVIIYLSMESWGEIKMKDVPRYVQPASHLTVHNDPHPIGVNQENIWMERELNMTKGIKGIEHVEPSIHDIQSVMSSRRQLIQQACKMTEPHPSINQLPWSEYILVSEKLKMVYCMVPKVASSSWLTSLLTLHMGHPPQDEDVWPIWNENVHPPRLTDYSREIQKKIVDEYFKFMFIRDPLDRFISAWNDKFNHSKQFYSERYGREIIKQYRMNPTIEALKTGDNVTFNEMVRYVTDITSMRMADEHWRPMTDLCHPCTIDYHVYGNFYNVDEESRFVFKNLNINVLESNITLPKKNQQEQNGNCGYQSTVETSKLKEFYSSISIQKVTELQNQYNLDYLLFSKPFQLKKLVED